LYEKFKEKFKTKSWLGRVTAGYYGCIHGWKKPIQETLKPLEYAHRVGMETGNIEFALLNANIYCWSQLDITPLPVLEKEILTVNERMEIYGQKLNMQRIKPAWQLIKNLMGQAKGDPIILTGDIMEESILEQWKHENVSVYHWSHAYRMMLAYLFGDYTRAERFSNGCRTIADYPWGAVDVAVVIFFDALTALAKARESKQKKAPLAEKRLVRLKYWANHSPHNFLGKQFLVEAEMAALAGQHNLAFSKYTCAIALSREGGFLMQTGLANERTGKHLLEQNDKESAVFYIREAISLYKRWGAKAKVKSLKDEMKDTF
jgi:histidine kinase